MSGESHTIVGNNWAYCKTPRPPLLLPRPSPTSTRQALRRLAATEANPTATTTRQGLDGRESNKTCCGCGWMSLSILSESVNMHAQSRLCLHEFVYLCGLKMEPPPAKRPRAAPSWHAASSNAAEATRGVPPSNESQPRSVSNLCNWALAPLAHRLFFAGASWHCHFAISYRVIHSTGARLVPGRC